jgi:hypothetical protein
VLRPVAFLVSVTLAGCARETPEDPALPAPGAGIPMGAVDAKGVSFDLPAGTPSLGPAPKRKHHGKAHPAPLDPVPPDPFEAPGDEPDPPLGPAPKKPKHSPSETTL